MKVCQQSSKCINHSPLEHGLSEFTKPLASTKLFKYLEDSLGVLGRLGSPKSTKYSPNFSLALLQREKERERERER